MERNVKRVGMKIVTPYGVGKVYELSFGVGEFFETHPRERETTRSDIFVVSTI